MNLSPPRLPTFLISLALIALVLVSYRWSIPTIGRFVVQHRVGMLVAAYAVLALGVLIPSL